MALLLNFVNYNYESMIAEAINNFYVEKKNLDVVFICKGNIRVLAHKIVIASASSFLKDMLSSVTQDTIYISLPDITEFQLRKVIDVLYKGSVVLKIEDLVDLKDLVSFLGIDLNNAEVHMSQQIIDAFDEDNQENTRNPPPDERITEEFQTQVSKQYSDSIISEISPNSIDIVNSKLVDQCCDVLNTERNYDISTKRLEQPNKAVARLKNANTMNSLTTSSGIDTKISLTPNDSIDTVNTESVDQCCDVLNTEENDTSAKRLQQPSKAVARLKNANTMNSLTISSGIDTDICLTSNGSSLCFDVQKICTQRNGSYEVLFKKSFKYENQYSKPDKQDSNFSKNLKISTLSYSSSYKDMKFKCDFCESSFKSNDQYKTHAKIHISDTLHSCSKCNQIFNVKANFISHIKVCSKGKHSCKICGFTDSCSCSLKAHTDIQRNKKPYKCEICNKKFKTKTLLIRDIKTHGNENPSKCKISDKSNRDLNHYKSIHMGEKPYKCKICDKLFLYFYLLNNHKRIHTGEKPYKCEICKKSFTNLNIHKRIHTGEKPYKCKICIESFAHASNMNIHKRIHTGEKPYKCKICNKEFKLRNTLINHIRTHTGEKPYKCKICNKSFSQATSLNIHKRIHTGEKPYKCKICNKEFRFRNTLIDHIRTHTGEKPYKCKICNKSFAQATTLNNHKRLHTGEKPYKCKICNKSFIQKTNLNVHKRKHIGSND